MTQPPEEETPNKEERTWEVLSLGAGVQSSVLALMAARGEITPQIDFAVFADTGDEPQSVYLWLDWLVKQLPFPVYTTKRQKRDGREVSLSEETLRRRISKDGRNMCRMDIPLFTMSEEGVQGKLPTRNCTIDHKVKPITKLIRRLCKIKRGQKTVSVTQWIGISLDELQRMKPHKQPWIQNRWPLVEQRMNREACLTWMAERGYPQPPRSSCVYCPFHSNAEWRRLKEQEPLEFAKAVAFEQQLQEVAKWSDNLYTIPFLHKSCKPIGEIDFDSPGGKPEEKPEEKIGEDKGKMWDDECTGMCGV